MTERSDSDDAEMMRQAIELLQINHGYDEETATRIAWHFGNDAIFAQLLDQMFDAAAAKNGTEISRIKGAIDERLLEILDIEENLEH